MKTLATHNGVLHTDDVAAVATIFLSGEDINVSRTRDSKIIESADIAVDVGGIFNGATLRFDHHQKEGAGKRPNGVPYASFGRVWEHFGLQVCKNILGEELDIDCHKVVRFVDEVLVQGIDARDCGVKTHFGLNNANVYTVSDLVSDFNPNWFEAQNFDEIFGEAVDVMKVVIKNVVRRQAGMVLAESEVLKMTDNQKGNKIIVLDKFVPWTATIPKFEPECLYVVFPDPTGSWRVQACPVGTGKESFELKAPLPAKWRGSSIPDLVEMTGCSDTIFCHSAGFIMGTKSKESAIKCAELAISSHEKSVTQ
jgi:uncharacterized UPF0160 family protein